MTDVYLVERAFPAVGKDSRMLRLLPRADMHGGLRCDSRRGEAAAERRIFQLDARFEHAGAWAGVRKLLEAAYLGLLELGKDAIVEEHAYELYMVLPEYRHRIHPRYLCLTDTAVGIEKTRFYPLERAYRLVHGLVGLVLQWKQALADRRPWAIVVWKFDDAQHLATRFFAELARRGASETSIEVLVETQNGQSDLLAHMPGMRVAPAATWTEAVTPDPDTCVSLDKGEAMAL